MTVSRCHGRLCVPLSVGGGLPLTNEGVVVDDVDETRDPSLLSRLEEPSLLSLLEELSPLSLLEELELFSFREDFEDLLLLRLLSIVCEEED